MTFLQESINESLLIGYRHSLAGLDPDTRTIIIHNQSLGIHHMKPDVTVFLDIQ